MFYLHLSANHKNYELSVRGVSSTCPINQSYSIIKLIIELFQFNLLYFVNNSFGAPEIAFWGLFFMKISRELKFCLKLYPVCYHQFYMYENLRIIFSRRRFCFQ